MKHYSFTEAERLNAQGLYRIEDEHDACGVGMIATTKGEPRRDVVKLATQALKAVWHRGAVNADGKTGDGAGIQLEIPAEFFRDYMAGFGQPLKKNQPFAVGMLFLPRLNYEEQERCRMIVEREIIHYGYSIHSWRQVPVNPDMIGPDARRTRPEIAQILIQGKSREQEENFERNLYIVRRTIEKKVNAEAIKEFHICSLSSRNMVYKGLFQAEQLEHFYPDLQDERVVSRYAIFHQRFSTNTAPNWHLAQPFQLLAHNGEINTVRGNTQWMRSHEASMISKAFGDAVEDIRPVIAKGSSDTAALNAAMELLVRAGRSLPLAKNILMPPTWSADPMMPEHHRALFSYCNCIMSPWDGPAAIAASDGKWVIAGMDRNGLRPMRYARTDNGLLLVGSEAGMVPVEEMEVVELGRLGPGQTIAMELESGQYYSDRAIKDKLADEYPYHEWIQGVKLWDVPPATGTHFASSLTKEEVQRRQIASGHTYEDMHLILEPMVKNGAEALGSMGDDTPMALLAKRYRGLHQFFRQNFSQVTNPPIDPIRERGVMSLYTRIGNKENILQHNKEQMDLLLLETPILLNADVDALRKTLKRSFAELDATFDVHKAQGLQEALDRLRQEADEAIAQGKSDILISNEHVSADRAAVPMILAVGALHAHLTRNGLRKKSSLFARTAEAMDTHHCAVLIGVGATAVNPYLSECWIVKRHKAGHFKGISLDEALGNYRTALSNGLLKIMSKMGISVISSYRGGKNFEAIGLSRSLVASYFPGLQSRISGIGLKGIQNRVLQLHELAYDSAAKPVMPIGGYYNLRQQGELHAHTADSIATLQEAVRTGRYKVYKRYAEQIYAGAPINLRDMLDFRKREAIPLSEVESVTEIRTRFIAPAMSMGALSPEAHEILAIAMNRMGANSNSGEGGEDAERFTPRANGDNANSAIKQVASGRFGVTADYLNQCREIQIKVAQGAKPGEGGQLPGFKVNAMIAKLRHATEGVTLISPPPHHDIYSIEDLAQLIYDLKQINPEAIVSVKLTSQSGIGTIASGVVKAMADKIVISGHSGGTGASPQTSVKFAGAPFEMGLAEAHQVLVLNGLRHRVTLQTDGGLRTGRDLVIAAMLGAEEFAVGTSALIAMGCLLVRQCHSNTCPVGICTQDEELRKKFEGTVEQVIHLFTFLAEEVREILASLGLRSLDEAIGRTDLLQQVRRGASDLDTIDLGPLLVQPDPGELSIKCDRVGRNEVVDPLDVEMMQHAEEALERGERIELAYNIQNTHRTIGTRLSSMMVRRYDCDALQPDHITLHLRGSAGQSLGAFAVRGLTLEVRGDANDYVGKGLSGATIIVRPRPSASFATEENTIIGNTCLYGATSGQLFAAGQAGERFAVRNSGANAVIEGCGSNGCEYMTGGTVVILGKVGHNFGAGMSGGMAFIYDHEGGNDIAINTDMVLHQRIESDYWEAHLKQLIEQHVAMTESRWAQNILLQWEQKKRHFWQVCPRDMVDRLEEPLSSRAANDAVAV